MNKHQHTALQQERTNWSLAMWKQGIYHNIHGIYRYIPCMNRVSTNPKCTYIFFNFDAITMSSHVTSMRECTNIGKSPWNVIKLLYVYTAIRIVYRDMHYLKHVYTAICIVYRRMAGGQDSRWPTAAHALEEHEIIPPPVHRWWLTQGIPAIHCQRRLSQILIAICITWMPQDQKIHWKAWPAGNQRCKQF